MYPKTKFYPKWAARSVLPAKTENLIRRHHSTPVVLFSAPFGYGKTSCLESLYAEHEAAIWISFDAYDNGGNKFWPLIAAGIQASFAQDAKNTATQKLHPEQPGSLSLCQAVLNELVEICDQSKSVLMIWDQFEHISDADLLDQINYFLDYLPANFKLYIGSNQLPDLQNSRRIARKELAQLGPKELAFDKDDLTQLAKTKGIQLGDGEIQKLMESTLGWPAFIIDLIKSVAGLHFEVCFSQIEARWLHYLADDFLSSCTGPEKQFLFLLAQLKNLNLGLCDYICSVNKLDLSLEQLTKKHFLLHHYQQARTSYSLHPLVKRGLERLGQQNTDRIKSILKQASAWHLEHDELEDALYYQFRLQDWESVGTLLAKLGPQLLERGKVRELENYFRQLPERELWQNPALLILKTWLLKDVEKYEIGETLLNRAETLIQCQFQACSEAENSKAERLKCEIYALRSTIARLDYRKPQIEQLANEALKHAEQAEIPLRYRSYLSLGADFYFRGELSKATESLNKAVQYAKLEKACYGLAKSLGYLCEVLYQNGKLKQAFNLVEENLEWLKEQEFNRAYNAEIQNFAYLALYLETNDTENLESVKKQLLTYCKHQNCDHLEKLAILLRCFHVDYQHENYQYAQNHLSEIERVNSDISFHWPFILGSLPALKAMLASQYKDSALALRWLGECLMAGDESFSGMMDCIIAVELLLKFERYDDALVIGKRIRTWARSRECVWLEGRATVFLTVALLHLKQKREAEICLSQMVIDARFSDYQRIFIVSDSLYVALIKSLVVDETYGCKKLTQLKTVLFAKSSNQVLQLSLREKEILLSVADGLSDKELARQLTISLGTVKTHLRNIYRKLDVNKRTQAVSKARELNLISAH